MSPRRLLPKLKKETVEEETARMLGLSIAKHRDRYKVWFESRGSYAQPFAPLHDFHEGGELTSLVGRDELEGFFEGYLQAMRIFK